MTSTQRRWTDAEWDALVLAVEKKINPRSIVVCSMVFASLMMLNAEILKSLIFCIGLHIAMSLRLGQRAIERLSVVLFILASMYWMDIASVQKWASLLGKKLSDVLT